MGSAHSQHRTPSVPTSPPAPTPEESPSRTRLSTLRRLSTFGRRGEDSKRGRPSTSSGRSDSKRRRVEDGPPIETPGSPSSVPDFSPALSTISDPIAALAPASVTPAAYPQPQPDASGGAPVERMLSRFRRTRQAPSEDARPVTPDLNATLDRAREELAVAQRELSDARVEAAQQRRIQTGPMLVIQGLAQTHADPVTRTASIPTPTTGGVTSRSRQRSVSVGHGERARSPPPAPPSIDNQARMIGSLLT
jgi:hypothetical protein